MNRSLATTFVLLFLATAPVMLVVRAWKPGRLPWWLLLAAVGGLSWTSLVVSEHFSKLADAECPPPLQTGTGVLECVGVLNDYAVSYNARLGWLVGLIYLSLLLPFYAAFIYFKRRSAAGRSLPNTSLERAREG
jgi:hypothetical protein